MILIEFFTVSIISDMLFYYVVKLYSPHWVGISFSIYLNLFQTAENNSFNLRNYPFFIFAQKIVYIHPVFFMILGVPRHPDDKSGDFNVFDDPKSPYSTFNFQYANEAFDRLHDLTEFNTLLHVDVSVTVMCVHDTFYAWITLRSVFCF